MITLIEAKNFRCLRYIRQQLGPFHVLVGPNASGKTTFLDVVAFLGSLVSNGLETAVGERTKNFQDVLWQRSGSEFELAIEAAVPEERRSPARPKEAVELALRTARKSRSSSLYDQLARQVSLGRCVDPAFSKLKTILQAWFPIYSNTRRSAD